MKKMVLICILGAGAILALLGGCQNNPSQLSPGDMLYRTKCSSCHRLVAPERLDREGWRRYVARYGKKMTAKEREVLLDYLVPDCDSQSQNRF